MNLDTNTIQVILDHGAIEIFGERFFRNTDGTYSCAFWNEAHCGYWKTYESGGIDVVMKNIRESIEDATP